VKINATAFLSGIIFAPGLGIGGMTQPAKIIGFLDIGGAWDLSLACVMGGAVAVYAVMYRLTMRRGTPLFAPSFAIPKPGEIDPSLVAGAALFGIGWGLGGFCPGPAIASLAWLATPVLIFVVAMCGGMILHGFVTGLPSRSAREGVTGVAIKADA
jgi:uncharacterized protein